MPHQALVAGCVVLIAGLAAPGEDDDDLPAALTGVSFTQVHIDGGFWGPRLEANRTTTVRYCLDKCAQTGRLDNFARAAGRQPGPHVGHRYNDSDVFKVIEGAACSLSVQRDPDLEARIDALIDDIAAAQEDDGYLFTTRTIDPHNPAGSSGDQRWSFIAHSHELYNVGHMYEAAVAYFEATGKRTLLDVAIRNADLIDSVFGPGQRHDPPGHQEIEIGLVKLARVTGDQRYLDLARFFIERRGRPEGRDGLYGVYAQDHAPVVEQSEPTGHAVRAMYLYSGMADVAARTGDRAWLAALDRIWSTLVERRLYLTGGVGARHAGEAFGEDYELPNASAYNETCAAIGNAMWNQRLGLLHRDARYVDVLERVLYNGFLSGVSLSGDTFFYPNPLASSGSYHRSPWFSCSCCPVNVVRFVPSIPGYVLAHDDASLYVNLYMACSARVEIAGQTVNLRQDTRYPWDGHIELTIDPTGGEATFDLMLRIPGWARGRPVPGDLYRYVDTDGDHVGATVAVNGEAIADPHLERGYLRIARRWSPGDLVTIDFDMPVRRVRSHDAVEANRGRLALERGPVVYCLEGVDHEGHLRNLWIPEDAACGVQHDADLLGGVTVIRGDAFQLHEDESGNRRAEPARFMAIAYYAWDHREPGEMAVWIPTSADLAEPIPPPTLAGTSRVTASHCWEGDTVLAVNDQRDAQSSGDHSIPRLTWWDHRGSREWVQYDFDEPQQVSSVAVYWFDDTGTGQCRVPAAWTIHVRSGDGWRPVETTSTPGTRADTFNRVEFEPVITTAVRLEVLLQNGFSAGVLEWEVE